MRERGSLVCEGAVGMVKGGVSEEERKLSGRLSLVATECGIQCGRECKRNELGCDRFNDSMDGGWKMRLTTVEWRCRQACGLTMIIVMVPTCSSLKICVFSKLNRR